MRGTPEEEARDREMLIEEFAKSLRPIPQIDEGPKGPAVLNVYDGYVGRVTHQITVGSERPRLRDVIGRAVRDAWRSIRGGSETVVHVTPLDK